jgi:2-iminobutanoate/2-iminopropanoate deaminase
METIATDGAPAAIGPYSQAVRGGGFLFCSGQIALRPGGSDLVSGGIEAETRQALENLKAVLEAGGSSLDRVVKTTVYLQSMDDFPAMNGIYEGFFSEHRPARAAVAVAQLPKGAKVEVDAIAL